MTIPSVTNSAVIGGNNKTTLDVTLSVSSGSGRVLLCWPALLDLGASGSTVSSVVFDPGGGDEASFTYETHATASDVTNIWRVELWYLVLDDGVSSGSYTVRVTYSAQVGRAHNSSWEVSGADTTDPIGATATASGQSSEVSVTVTTTETNSLVGMGINYYDNTTFTAGTGDTEETEYGTGGSSTWTGHTPASTTGDYTVSCTDDASGGKLWAAVGAEILEAGGAPPAAGPQLLALLGVGG